MREREREKEREGHATSGCVYIHACGDEVMRFASYACLGLRCV